MTKQYKRRIIYIDGTLQGRLITALILLESTMVITALIYLRYRYSVLLDEYLYSIHLGSIENMFFKLLNELVIIVVAMSAINFAALIIANALWGRHINHIIACFRKGLKQIKALNLKSNTQNKVPRHEVIEQLDAWRNAEKERCKKLIGIFSRIDSYSSENRDEQLLEIHKALALLPAPKV